MIHLPDIVSPLPASVCFSIPIAAGILCLLLLWLLKWRHNALAAKYAGWQKEAQTIESATHDGLYRQPFSTARPPYPYVSIVIPSCDDAEELGYLLPRLTLADYKGRFEIIVADQLALDEIRDVAFRAATPDIAVRYTRVPRTSRQIEMRKLAITLGIKAAHGEWVVIVDPHTVPEQTSWLQHLAENLNDEVDFVEAYYNYYDEGSMKARRAILDRVYDLNLRLNAHEKGLVLGCPASNYAIRKQWFVNEKGFADSLNLPFGEESIFAFLHAQSDRTVLLCSPDTKLTEYLPTGSTLAQRRLFKHEALHQILRLRPVHYSRSAFVLACHLLRYRTHTFICTLITYMWVACFGGYAVCRFIQDTRTGVYDQSLIIHDIAMSLLLILSIVLPIHMLRKSLHALHERRFGLYVIYYDIVQPIRLWLLGIKGFFLRKSYRRRKFA